MIINNSQLKTTKCKRNGVLIPSSGKIQGETLFILRLLGKCWYLNTSDAVSNGWEAGAREYQRLVPAYHTSLGSAAANWPHRHYFSLLPSKADLSSLYSNHVDLLATSLSSRINCGVAQIQAILGSHKNILSLLTPG